jgi:hypothetical protein
MSDIQIRSTGTTEVIQSSDGRITLTVPIQIKRRSGRKQMTLPNGQSGQPGKLLRPWDVAATPLQLALARGHRWLAMLESGQVKNLTEIAALEGVDNSYVSRMVNLTTLAPGKLLLPWDVAATPLQLALARGHRWLAMLAPDIVEAILEDALPDHLTLFDIAVDPPALWEEQRERVCMNSRSSLQHL